MVNLIVAFGFEDDVYFIAAGRRCHKSNIPQGMASSINVRVEAPFNFVSLGEGRQYFVSGRSCEDSETVMRRFNTGNLTALDTKIMENPTTGVCFGPNNSWTWYSWDGETYDWSYNGLDEGPVSFIKGQIKRRGQEFRIVIGAENATVLLYSDGAIAYHSCGDYLADSLSTPRLRRYNLKYLALSPTHVDWFFIQFEDDSVTWYTSTIMGERLLEYARCWDLVYRRPRTLEVLE